MLIIIQREYIEIYLLFESILFEIYFSIGMELESSGIKKFFSKNCLCQS